MPRLSLVLVVHGEQAYVRELAESALGQDFADIELIAIDDASPDHGPALLDELAAGDPRVKVTHLPERIGMGAARNLGLEQATGDYVWFVNATDQLLPGSLRAVVDRLDATAAEVLVVHHARADRLRRRHSGPAKQTLARAAARGPAPIGDHPGLADIAPPAWNKVFRREALRSLGVRFGAGGHDALTVTWPALLAAERIAALPERSYVRYLPANATRDPHPPADALDQYDSAFKDLPPERRELATGAMLRHLLGILGDLPEADRPVFFHGISERLRRHGTPTGGGAPARLRARLVAGDRYTAFRLLERSLEARVRLKRRGRRRKKPKQPLDSRYSAHLDRPIDPDLAVFAAYWYRGYACNPRAIYETARALVPGMRGVWAVKPDAAGTMPEGVEFVVEGSDEYFETLARARYFVNNVNFPNWVVKRTGTTHVMTHHGTPLKRMGLDQQSAPDGGRRPNFGALLRRCSRWDYSVSANVFSTLIWERAYPLPYESIESGYPRNDALATATEQDIARVRSQLGISPGQIAVLYAPTHREYEDGYVPTLDVASVADALGPGYTVLSRLHYFYDSPPRDEGARVLDVHSHPSVEELCVAADVLITDYSSIMFDYAVLDRPIVIHAPDWDTYRTMRGVYFDLIEEPPGTVTTTEADVVDALRSGRASGHEATAARAAFRARFCSLEDGRAAERVVRRVWLGEAVTR